MMAHGTDSRYRSADEISPVAAVLIILALIAAMAVMWVLMPESARTGQTCAERGGVEEVRNGFTMAGSTMVPTKHTVCTFPE